MAIYVISVYSKYSWWHIGLPSGSLKNTGHWQCQCRCHEILSFWHMHCPVMLSFLYRTKGPKYWTVRKNTGHLATQITYRILACKLYWLVKVFVYIHLSIRSISCCYLSRVRFFRLNTSCVHSCRIRGMKFLVLCWQFKVMDSGWRESRAVVGGNIRRNTWSWFPSIDF